MDPQLDEPDLRSYLGIIARRKRWVVGVTFAFFALAVAMSVLPDPQYKAKATVLTSTGTNLAVLAMGGNPNTVDPNRDAENHAARIDGYEMRVAVIDALTPSLDPADVFRVEVTPVQRTNDANRVSSVVELSLVSTDPDSAAEVLNTYSKAYVEEWNALNQELYFDTLTRVDLARAEVTDQITEAEGELDALLQDRAASGNDQVQIGMLDSQIDGKNIELDTLRRRESEYQDKFEQLSFGGGFQIGTAEPIGSATPPRTPVSPNIPKNLAIGMVFGLFLGTAIAFIRDYFDDSVKSKEIVEQVTGVPALGLIPKFSTSDSELVAAAAPSSPAAEAFRSLRTSVKFLSVDRDIRVVQVTSPSPGEGKTVTAINLATVFAQAGDRVVLVGADMRRPRAEDVLGVPLTPGLTGVLIGEVALPQAIRAVDGLPNLSVLPAGYPPPNPSELLSGERARRLVDVLAQTYDLVVLDCPPVLPVSDALVLAGMADATLLVTSANRTSRRALDRCVEVLQQVSAPLVGTVMTALSPGETFGGGPYSYDSASTGRYKAASHSYSGGGNGFGAGSPQYSSDATAPTQQVTMSGQPVDGESWTGSPPPRD
jgi:polysaccharide biosynthesis transport protein